MPPSRDLLQPEGTIITFYSFKGGAGRSMALANLVYFLANQPGPERRILAIDWDLEAPGLHKYFGESGHETHGVIDYFSELYSLLRADPRRYNDLDEDTDGLGLATLLPLDRYCTKLDLPGQNETFAQIEFMPAGLFDAGYAERVGTFPWVSFFTEFPKVFSAFRGLLANRCAYVLIDSRTGLTDTSGICTMIMPSKLAAVFTPNAQSLEGLVDLLNRALKYRGQSDDHRALSIFPAPSRIENVPHLQIQWRERYQAAFEELLKVGKEYDGDITTYFNDVRLPHVADYAFGEQVALRDEQFSELGSLRRAYETFFRYLIERDVPWDSTTPYTSNNPNIIGSGPRLSRRPLRVFVAYARQDEEVRRELLDTIADWQREGVIESVWSDREIAPGEIWDQRIKEAVESADLILVLMSRNSLASEYIASVELVRALERHERGEARVVPIIVRPCDWQSSRLARLQVLPSGGKPISRYADPEDFWLDVRQGLKKIVQEISFAGNRIELPAMNALERTGTNPVDNQPYVWIPPGEFQMGASVDDADATVHERPQHRVAITSGFWISQTPVTVEAYLRFVAACKRKMPEEPDFPQLNKHPVMNVTWQDARDYCAWAGGRLPTEAEWEYAARGGSSAPRYGPLDSIAWYIQNSGSQTHAVGQLAPNSFGAYDMLGNVWEWCQDWFSDDYYKSSAYHDPAGPKEGKHRVSRGGAWYTDAGEVRVSARDFQPPAFRFNGLGFRCVREVIL
jgi:formylglycine-generating enzyme required for sulfatase activity/cellulose biosynthesis protein BcsQ